MREIVERKQAIVIEPGSPAEFAGSVFHHLYGEKWIGDFNQPYVLSRKFKEMTYSLITNMPKSASSRSSGQIAVDGRDIRYEFDEDHLGVLLHHKGQVLGAAGFRKLYMGASLIAEGPGQFYLLILPGKCLLIIPHAPGRYRFKGDFSSKEILACPVGFEGGALKAGKAKTVKPKKISGIDFMAGEIGRFWLIGSKNQIKSGIRALRERLA
jgi:hypothetical protein